MFHVIEGATIILRSGGVYKQAKVFRYQGNVFAAHSGGYIKLTQGGTSHPSILWENLQWSFADPHYDALGRMVDPDASEWQKPKPIRKVA